MGKLLMWISVIVFIAAGVFMGENGAAVGLIAMVGFIAGCVIRWKEEAPERKKRVDGWEIAEVTLVGEPEAKVKGGAVFVAFVTGMPLRDLNPIKKMVQKFTVKYVNGYTETKVCKIGSPEYYALMERISSE